MNLHVRTAGPDDGRLVVLLHGFPELWYGWRHQIPALTEASCHVAVPDQRGYSWSDAPQAVAEREWRDIHLHPESCGEPGSWIGRCSTAEDSTMDVVISP